jgi:hypothetical protein
VAAQLAQVKGAAISVAEVGTVQEETLAGEIARSVLEEGATGLFVTENGTDVDYFEAPSV